MNYIGTKLSLKPFIKEKILEVSRLDKEDKTSRRETTTSIC